jgi:hypothetical protein
MALYLLHYDLRKQRNYQTLYDELEKFKAVHVLESSWCFNRINTDCSGLRDYFRKFIDGDDGLCVTEVNNWATYKTLGTPKDL